MKNSNKNDIMNNYDNYINNILKKILNKDKKNFSIIRNAILLKKRFTLNPLILKNEPQKDKSMNIEDKNLINNLNEFKEDAYNLIHNYNQEKKRASNLVINNKIFQKDYSKMHHRQNNIQDNYYLNKSWMVDTVNKYYNKGFQKVPSLNIERNIFTNNPLIIGDSELLSFFSFYKKENSAQNSKNFLEKSLNILEEKLGLKNSGKKEDENEIKRKKKRKLKEEIEENYNKINKIKEDVVKSNEIFNNLDSIDKIFHKKKIPKLNLLNISKNNNDNNNNKDNKDNDNNLINEYSFINNNKIVRNIKNNKFSKNSIFKYYIRNSDNIKSLSSNFSTKEQENSFDYSSFRDNLLLKKQIKSKNNSSSNLNSNILNDFNENLINSLTYNHSNKDFIKNVYNVIKNDDKKFYFFEKEFYNFCVKNNRLINKDISKKGLYYNFLNIKKVFKNNDKNIILKIYELKNKEAKKTFFSNYQKEILLKNDNLNIKFNKIDALVKEKLYDFNEDKNYNK